MDGAETATAPAQAGPPEAEQPAEAPRPRRGKKPAAVGVAKTLVRVTFTDLNEFMAELIADAELIEDGIVRITVRESHVTPGYLERQLQVVAGYVVRGQVMEVQASGQAYWGNPGAPSDEAATEAAGVLETVRTTCQEGGLEVLGGRFGAI